MASMAARDAAQARGLPPKVLPCLPTGGVTLSEQSTAPMGRPPAMALARHRMSGSRPKCSQANIFPVRQKPVWTSSMTSSTPRSRHSSPTWEKNSALPRFTPPSPWTTSSSTAAVSSPTCASSLAKLLKGANRKPSTTGTKGSRYSRVNVALRAPMVRPWNPRMAHTSSCFPVVNRANLMAASMVSAPELHR